MDLLKEKLEFDEASKYEEEPDLKYEVKGLFISPYAEAC